MERYFVSIRIQSKRGKTRTRKAPNTDTSHAVLNLILSCVITYHLHKTVYNKFVHHKRKNREFLFTHLNKIVNLRQLNIPISTTCHISFYM